MKIEIWSDVVCPWCYIGKQRLDEALARFGRADDIEVVWRAFELNPNAPRSVEGDYVARLATKYGVSVGEAQRMIDRMTNTGAEADIGFRFDIAKPGNTFDAHRLICFGGEKGVQRAVVERLFEATFTEGKPIADRDTLVELAAEAGLDPDEVRSMLAADRYADEVRSDEEQARAFGITGVPFFVVDRAYGVSGAQSPDVLVKVFEEAWTQAHSAAASAG